MNEKAAHWDQVYASKAVEAVSWYRPHLDVSLALLEGLALANDAAILDVGAGASSFLADLLARGFNNLAALDISAQAVAVAKSRLGADASRVRWIVADVSRVDLPPSSVDLWHDRAAFHFLNDPADRAAYAALAARAIRIGGHALIAGFAPDGPQRCSDLDVVRASPEEIHSALGGAFRLVRSGSEQHRTPWGAGQAFAYALCERVP